MYRVKKAVYDLSLSHKLLRLSPLHTMQLSFLWLVLFTTLDAIAPFAYSQSPKPNLWLIGDSTVNNNVSGGVGWGNVVASRFDSDKITVINRAIAGRSSRSFSHEFDFRINQYASVTRTNNFFDAGDYMIIQFGHNDGPNPATDYRGSIQGIGNQSLQGTDRNGQPETVYTYGEYLRRYVDLARGVGAIPIIASYVPRAGNTNPTLSAYGLWAQQVAQQEDVAFLNLYGPIATSYAEQVAANSNFQGDYIRSTFFGPDATHTNLTGAEWNADFVAAGIRQGLSGSDGASGLSSFLVTSVPEPTFGGLISLLTPMLLTRRRCQNRV